MSRLETEYKGIKFPNPFLLASSPISRNASMIMRAFEAGWGGAVTKTICLNPETIVNVKPRFQKFTAGRDIIGFNNIELISERPLSVWLDDLEKIKLACPENVLVASIMAEAYNYSGWQQLAKFVENAGADIIELNLSCPHGMPERGMGSFCSEMPDISANIINCVKQVSKIPVWAKLSPNVADISYLAQVCLDSRADGLVAINTVKGFSGIDVETLQPKLNVDGMSAYGGFSGKMIKPIALKAVSDIASSTGCYISGSGGICDWNDAAEFLLLGASSIQICTEVMLKGYGIIDDLKSGLEDYMIRHNFNTINEMTGKCLEKISSFEGLNAKTMSMAFIDSHKCVGCGKCHTACRDGGHQAIRNNDGSYSVNPLRCSACGLCNTVCPTGAASVTTLVCKR